jgi:hypothetical protein
VGGVGPTARSSKRGPRVGDEPISRCREKADAKVDLITGGFTQDGALGPTFGTNGTVRIDVALDTGPNGWRPLEAGRPNDSFFGVAVSPDKSRVAVVGPARSGRGRTGPARARRRRAPVRRRALVVLLS